MKIFWKKMLDKEEFDIDSSSSYKFYQTVTEAGTYFCPLLFIT